MSTQSRIEWGWRTPKAGGRPLDGRTWNQLPIRTATPREGVGR